jgi:hypothetical protein
MNPARDNALGCPSDFGLDRLRLGELAGSGDEAETLAHLRQCLDCSRRLRELGEPPTPMDLEAVWRRVRRGIVRQALGWLLEPAPRWFLLAGGVAAVLALTWRSPAPPDIVIKGGPWRLGVIARTDAGRTFAATPGSPLSAGDRLRFEVSTTWPRGFAAVISLDSAGVVSPLVPAAGQAAEVRGGRRLLLDAAVELDETLGPERILLVGCPRAIPVADVVAAGRKALARAQGDLRAVGDLGLSCEQETFWIVKVRR